MSTRQNHRDDDLESSLHRLSLSNVGKPDSPSGTATFAVRSDESHDTSQVEMQFKSLQEEYRVRLRSFSQLTEILVRMPDASRRGSREELLLQEQISWMTTTMCNLKALSLVGCSSNLQRQRETLSRILEDRLEDIKRWERTRYDVLQKQRIVDEHSIHTPPHYDSNKFFKHSLEMLPPLILLPMFISAVLNVIHELPERSSNYLLQMHRDLLKSALNTWNGSGEFVVERNAMILRIPKDIRTVRSRFGLEPSIRIFAVCPKCSALFEPEHDSTLGIDRYPVTRCNQKELDGFECGAVLLKWRVKGQQSVRVPSRPYGYYGLHDFVGEMLCRPKLEDLLERRPSVLEPDVLHDIFDGRIIRDFKGPDGERCFHMNGVGSKLYLAWALCVDWYNPYHNKIAGKAVSIGVISMVCLNLPLAMRNEIPNMYLVGIIPGPREPSLHQVNNFMAPVIKDFQESWGKKGVQYTRTHKFANGRTVVSILIPLVADLPASRKVSGTVGHQATCFCPLCLRKKDEVSDFSVPMIERDRELHMQQSKQWKDAKTLPERVELARKNGVRYSVIFDLPYWEPRFIVVDTMHNLFLGIIKHHFREVIGIKYEKRSEGKGSNTKQNEHAGTLNPKVIRNIMDVLSNPQGPTFTRLKKFSAANLRGFIACQSIDLPANGNASTSASMKDHIIWTLLNSELVAKSRTVNSQETGVERTNFLRGDALPFYSVDDATIISSAPDVLAGHAAWRRPATSSTAGQKAKTNPPPVLRLVSSEEIEAIQTAIRKTSRPSWQQGPPKAFGTSQQGKLKADQWRSLIEFDLPVALVELWVDVDDTNIAKLVKDRRLALVDLTMELAIAVFWGTSRQTSALHAATYLLHLQRYLAGLDSLTPRPKFVPNHHSALHVGELLLLFGPVTGWWAYPYERLIGALQKVNSNYRIGEIELTMLRSFYASAHLQRLFKTDECPSVLSDHIKTFENHLPLHAQGSYGFNVSQTSKDNGKDAASAKKHFVQLDIDIYDAVCSLTANLRHPPNRQFLVHRSYTVEGVQFTTREFERDSIIFYGADELKTPGVIRKIFSLENGKVMFAVHPYLKVGRGVADPFTRWPEFRASLWSQRVEEQVQLIDPIRTHICHAARRPWRNQEIYVLRAIDRKY